MKPLTSQRAAVCSWSLLATDPLNGTTLEWHSREILTEADHFVRQEDREGWRIAGLG